MSYRPYRKWLRCNECRTRRSNFQLLYQHQKTSPECKPCGCGGYHFAHRPGSPYCEQNPTAPLRHALRAVEGDEETLEVLIDWALFGGPHKPGGSECPF